MMRFFAIILLVISFSLTLYAQKGHNVRVKLDNYAEKELVLAFHYGDKQYIKDTVALDAEGYFTFKADTLLPCGMYLLVMKPDNNFVQVLLSDDQDFTMVADAKNPVPKAKITGSEDNALFYSYMRLLGDLRPEADTLRAQLDKVRKNKADSTRIANKLADMDKQVKQFQRNITTKYATTLTAKIIKASEETEMPKTPEYQGDSREAQLRRYYFYRDHYFDNIDIGDPCMLRGPVLFGKLDYYVNKLTVQHPDSINAALDIILGKMPVKTENFRYFLVHFLNAYAKSNFVGMDACYVHLAKNYYCKGLAPWADKTDLEKICDNARRLDPILIGRIAPNIAPLNDQGKPVSLYDIDADYTVLVFWDPECSHCKKSAPFLVDFNKKFKDKGVKVYAVCTAKGDKAGECAKSIQEKEFNDFINLTDPYLQTRYHTLYDVQSTPQIFILNRKHEILMKRIEAEKLPEIMQQVMEIQKAKG
jgi:peroxiredoxin